MHLWHTSSGIEAIPTLLLSSLFSFIICSLPVLPQSQRRGRSSHLLTPAITSQWPQLPYPHLALILPCRGCRRSTPIDRLLLASFQSGLFCLPCYAPTDF